jgi:hypothetical protein
VSPYNGIPGRKIFLTENHQFAAWGGPGFSVFLEVIIEVFSYLVAETKDCEMSQKCIVSVKFLINAVKRNV